MRLRLMLLACLLSLPHFASAQQPIQASEVRYEVSIPAPLEYSQTQLRDWEQEYSAWLKWFQLYGNRIEYGWFSPRSRRPLPSNPPVWLADVCVLEENFQTTTCQLYQSWKDDFASQRLRQKYAYEKIQKEKPVNTKFWEHIHLDGLWVMTQTNTSTYGLVGAHVAGNMARFEFFMAPGVMLVSSPGMAGSQQMQVAYDYGFGFKLFDFRSPVANKTATLHFDFVRVWLNVGAGFEQVVNLAGFSLTLGNKK